jgi:hydrophobic/amphiphilic exporter-1 (mainly G- bacteria), HAE1 family
MIELSIKRPLLVFVMFSIIALLGIITFQLLNINLTPKISDNVITISTIYPGASASEVETSVTKKIEDAVSSLENIKTIKSVSQEGFEFTTIGLKSTADVNVSLQDAQRKINAILADLPTDVKTPTISKFSTDDMPVLQGAVSANIEAKTFYKLVEDRIQPRLAKLQGVGQINLIGGTEREILVNIDQDKLKTNNLSILQVLQAIGKANMDFPTGSIEQTDKKYTVRLSAKYESLEQLKNTIVFETNDNSKILVKDVADIVDGKTDETKICRLNGKDVIGFQVQKQSDANAVAVCNSIKKELKSIETEYQKDNLKFDVATDISIYTMESVNGVVEDLFLAVFIVSLVCLLFLHSLRTALIVMVAVPLSMLPSFIFLYAFGYSLNIMSLMALSLAVGILVDDSIVVVENIFRHLEMGKTKLQAALEGSKQIFFTATSITLVIVSVFLPLSLTGGIIGGLLKEFSMPLIVSTITSLLVSFSLTPLLLSRFGQLENISTAHFAGRFVKGFENVFEEIKLFYESVLRWGLNNRKKIFAGVIVLFFLSLSFVGLGFIGSAFMPDTDQSEFVIDLEMAPQTSVYQNNMITKQVEEILLAKPEVVKVMANVGLSSSVIGMSSRNNITQLTVTIVDKNERSLKVAEYGENIKDELLKTIPGVKVRTSPTTITGSASVSPIQFVVKGTDLKKVDSTAAMVLNIIKKIPGTTDAKFSIDDPKPEVSIKINRNKMEELGLSVADVGATLRTALAGNTDSKYKDGAYEYDINIAFDKFDRRNIFDVAKISFINNRGQLVELNQFADVTQTLGPSMLERFDRMSSITINSNAIGRASGTIGAEIEEQLKGKIPNGISVEKEGMLKQQSDAFSSLGFALIAAIILIYLIMVALYNSLLHPFVVLFSIPTAIIGSLLALALTLDILSIFSIIGLITLLGLVAKNAILLVDFTNELVRNGKDLIEALVEAGKERLRPILMTTLAMVFGMLPLAIANGAGSELKNGLAWVIIGGLISSLILTLVVVPCVYLTAEKMKRKIQSKRKIKQTELAEAVL